VRSITNEREVLFTCTANLDRPIKISLCKQSYSDGTCFYTLQDQNGNWKVEYGSRDLNELIEQINHELKVEEEYRPHDMIKKYPQIKYVYDEVLRWRKDILSNLQALTARDQIKV
jgi:hypothetical protein